MRASLTISLLSVCLFANAQFNNGGFEDLNSQAMPQYWQGDLHIFAITVDSNGVFQVDSVVYDAGSDYALSTDAHSGQYAIELRNAYNYTQDEALVGRVHANSDTTNYQGFPLVTVPVTQRPASIGFWAKYAPLADDSAQVTVTVLDEAESTIGTGLLTIGGTVSQYTAFDVPVIYSTEDVAAFIQLTFANATFGGTASFGTRLLIDDVSVTFTPDAVNEAVLPASSLSVFPVPADAQCTVRPKDGAQVLSIAVLCADGRIAATPAQMGDIFDTSALAAGSYVLSIRTTTGFAKARLMVNH